MSLSLPGFRKGKQVPLELVKRELLTMQHFTDSPTLYLLQIPESVLFQHVPKEEVVREAAEMLITNCLAEVGSRPQLCLTAAPFTISCKSGVARIFCVDCAGGKEL